MSRSIKHKYTKAKSVSRQCRNHGKCPYCVGNRTYKNRKRKESNESNEKTIRVREYNTNIDRFSYINSSTISDLSFDGNTSFT